MSTQSLYVYSSSDVLMLTKVITVEVSGADRTLIGSETSGRDWQQIGSGSSKSCDLSKPIRGSE